MPPHKRDISAILARDPFETRHNSCHCDTISKGYCAIWVVSRTGPPRASLAELCKSWLGYTRLSSQEMNLRRYIRRGERERDQNMALDLKTLGSSSRLLGASNLSAPSPGADSWSKSAIRLRGQNCTQRFLEGLVVRPPTLNNCKWCPQARPEF